MYHVYYEKWLDDYDYENHEERDSNGEIYYSINVNDIFYDEDYLSDVFYNTDDPPKVGDEVFLVYVIYSSGDSNCIEHGNNIYPICITKDESYAEKIKKILMDSENDVMINVEIPLENGKTATIDTPWNDYFGYLNYVAIDKFTIKKKYLFK